MIIESKFRDYYDKIAGQIGVDKTIVYNRKTEEVQGIELPFANHFGDNLHEPGRFGSCLYSWHVDVVGFCGRIYPVLVDEHFNSSYETGHGFVKTYTFGDEIRERLTVLAHKYFEPRSMMRHSYSKSNYDGDGNFDPFDKWNRSKKTGFVHRRLSEYMREWNGRETDELFHKLKTPVFVLQHTDKSLLLVKNLRLQDMGFVKVVDPFTAYDSIMSYISGKLGTGENNTVEVSDKSKAESHGYDKWSFRREPGGVKRRKHR